MNESPFDQLDARISQAMIADRHRLRRMLRAIETDRGRGKPVDQRVARLVEEIDRSAARCEARRRGVPAVRYDPDLPVCGKRDDIARAIRENQVVIVCGETGSGKSTQLPKICLEMGRGVEGLIGHTQPRRIAARSVAARIAEELGSPLGRDVGFKVRFAESIGPQSYVKLMTDGILLAETQSDPLLEQYDTIILDEAHERSLNVDFLIGYLKRLLPKRPDLRLIVTSATIDAARFAEHFAGEAGPAPIVEVSGRSYPVDVLWRPMEPDENGDEPDLQDAVRRAIEEVSQFDRGDILVFMPTERDIHETAKSLRGRPLPGDPTGQETDLQPLYARLSIQEQQRVFHPGPRRRIVIATNVAESSLTVPRIRFVIDPGTARISRYSPRTKTQRLPIEAVSQASADQRMGRCGRVGPGVCVRLFSEEDYLGRDRYTMPEIQRTNLAAVILKMKALRLGELEQFPLIDPPKPDAVRDGYRTLFELGAIDENEELTEFGRRLSRLPVDPRIGRMILASIDEGCLPQMLIIASALEVQDPRERPLEKQEAADASHAQFADEQSDFLGYLKLWNFYHKLKGSLSRSQLQKACRQNFLSYLRIREWLDVHRELMEIAEGGKQTRPLAASQRASQGIAKPQAAGSPPSPLPLSPSAVDAIHRAILTGLLSSVALRGESNEYTVAGGGKAMLWPGSGVFHNRPKWIVAAELVETTRRYLRTCARIDPRWIEPLAGHVIKRTYSDLYWNSDWASAAALERLTLFGLPVVAGRPVRYGPIDPAASRQLFVEHALVYGDLNPKPTFLVHNESLREKMEELQAKLRRRDLLASDGNLYAFYDERLPADVYDGATLTKWLRADRDRHTRQLTMTESDLVREPIDVGEGAFPDRLPVHNLELPLEYAFEPGSEHDGVTMSVPLEALGQVDPEPLEWLVPGLLEEKVLAMIRSLPKALRTRFVPAPTMARQVATLLRHGEGNLRQAVAAVLSRIGGVAVSPGDFESGRLPPELQMNVRVTGDEGQTLASGRNLPALRQQLAVEAAEIFTSIDDPRWNRDGLVAWDFDELPPEIEIVRGGLRLKAHPALVDRRTSVSLRLMESPGRADHETHFALRRLFLFTCSNELETQVDWLPGLEKVQQAGPKGLGFDLRRQLVEVLADRAFFGENVAGTRRVPSAELEKNLADGTPTNAADGTRSVPATLLPRTKAEFDARIEAGRQRIGWAVQELTALTGPWFEAYREVQQALAPRTAPAAPAWGRLTAGPVPASKWQYALDDIREQLDALTAGDAISSTPWNWLRQFPRYFRAICMRLDALAGGGAGRDRQSLDELRPRWELYLETARQHAAQNVYDPELVQYRWMLEEYRVSLFAQKLGTAVPVSPKRLDQQWAKVRG